MAITMINQRHIICQSDQIVKPDIGVVGRSLNFLNMVALSKVEVVMVRQFFISVQYNLAVAVGREENFFCMPGFFAKINVWILCKDSELYAFQFFIRVITVTFDDRKAYNCALTF